MKVIIYYRAGSVTPITGDQLRRYTAHQQLLEHYGVEGECINVGNDKDLERRVVEQVGLTPPTTAEDWPIVLVDGSRCSSVDEMEMLLEEWQEKQEAEEEEAASPVMVPVPSAPVAEEEAIAAPVPSAPALDAEPIMEQSVNVLDMRLSVLGTQLDDMQLSQYPNLDSEDAMTDTAPQSLRQSPELTAVDEALEGLEWVTRKGLSWVSSVVPAAVGFAPTPPSQPPLEPRQQSLPEYEVVQTNWYGRQQRRHLRVSDKAIERLHPMTGEVRNEVPLSELVCLTRTRQGLLVSFKSDIENEMITDTYHTSYADEIIQAVQRQVPRIRVLEK